jgi:hypothetical protein
VRPTVSEKPTQRVKANLRALVLSGKPLLIHSGTCDVRFGGYGVHPIAYGTEVPVRWQTPTTREQYVPDGRPATSIDSLILVAQTAQLLRLAADLALSSNAQQSLHRGRCGLRRKRSSPRFSAAFNRLKGIERDLCQAPDQQLARTDPIARSMATSGRGSDTVGYNVHIAVETEHCIIVATPKGTDPPRAPSGALAPWRVRGTFRVVGDLMARETTRHGG